jgi:CRISPR-associated endoribonuclease Cas2 subtype I-E
VFVANLPASTRAEIWDHVVAFASNDTKAVMVWSNRGANEQGLEVRTLGTPRRRIVDREGLLVSSWIPADETAPGPE